MKEDFENTHYSDKQGHKERGEMNKALKKLGLSRDYAWMLRRSMMRDQKDGKK